MSEIMDLVVIEKKNAMAVFTNNDQLDPLIELIEKEARSLVPDVTTKKGRDAIASMAHKVARSKTYIDNAGKDLVAELKALPKQIDESRRVVRERRRGGVEIKLSVVLQHHIGGRVGEVEHRP